MRVIFWLGTTLLTAGVAVMAYALVLLVLDWVADWLETRDDQGGR